jgi:hypothetical protein
MNDCDITGHILVGGCVVTIAAFWILIQCEVVGGYKRFGGTCYVHLQGLRVSFTFDNELNVVGCLAFM